MLLRVRCVGIALAGLLTVSPWATVSAQQVTTVQPPSATQAEATLKQAAADGKYTFLLFYKTNDAATQAMTATLKEGLASRTEKALSAYVQVGQPAEKALVDKFDVSRAPMPMTIAVAPNGAITGMFAQKLSAEGIENSFVTPTMTGCMKSLQAGKLVFVCVQGSAKAPAPASLKDFQADPHFKDRLVSFSLLAADPAEAKFLKQMQIDAAKATGTTTVLLAPPGVLVGKFDAFTSKDDIAAALAKAGKCCDDPNCKHHQHQPAPRTTSQPPATRR
ncbi:MAG: hypothetical protein AABP62_11965 [Planctomycetota bacterium]